MVDASRRDTDDLLRQQLAVEPDVRVRARMLGHDYDVIHSAAERTFIGAQVLPAIVGLICLVAALLSGSEDSPLDGVLRTLSLVLLGLVPLVLTMVSMTLLAALAALPPVPQLVVGTGIVNVVQVAAIAFLAQVAPDALSGRLLVLAGIAGTAGVMTGVVTRAPDVLLQSNAPTLVDAFRLYNAIPQWQTALGGRSRWLIAGSAAELVSVVGLFVVASTNVVIVIPVAVLWVGAQVLAGYLGLRDNTYGWLALQVVAALVVAAVAIVMG